MKKTIAFIFARGGSKGLPLKNQLLIAGHPLIAYSIYIARINPLINEVYVSTDSEVISKIAINYGAKIIKRPEELAKDDSPEYLSWKHAIQYVHKHNGSFEKFISLPPTSPLRSLKDTKDCISALSEDVDVVITITPSNRSPWFNMVKKKHNDYLSILLNSDYIYRRQDAPKTFDMTTVAYVSTPEFILNSSKIWDGKVKGVLIPKERALDIDDKFDFLIADYFIKERKDLLLPKID
tara:strand:+ start:3904 stop:4614 length:711 start_codon:yes stop_codon:yes gene_type:complete